MIDFSLRIGIFMFLLCLLIIWQWKTPRTPLHQLPQRWLHNFSLLFLGALCVRLIQPLLLSLVTFINVDQGLFNLFNTPYWAQFLFSLIALDGLIYWQHRLFHRIPALWRLHKIHHSDQSLDVSSAVRFHPLEILLSLCIKATAVLCLGIPIEAILTFDILLNACAMFNHTNVRLPKFLESSVRFLLVTPDMHRIHHSTRHQEINSNYGFCLSVWDRLFHSYVKQAEGGDSKIQIGLPELQDTGQLSLKALLLMPFMTSSSIQESTNNKKP